jgi:hypothetical protein
MKNSIMISNGGNFQHTPDNAQVVSSKDERLSKYYRDLGLHFEMRFYDFMKIKKLLNIQDLTMLMLILLNSVGIYNYERRLVSIRLKR